MHSHCEYFVNTMPLGADTHIIDVEWERCLIYFVLSVFAEVSLLRSDLCALDYSVQIYSEDVRKCHPVLCVLIREARAPSSCLTETGNRCTI